MSPDETGPVTIRPRKAPSGERPVVSLAEAVELRYEEDGLYEELVALKRGRADRATGVARASVLVDVARVERDRLGDGERALSTLMEALDCDPRATGLGEALERAARETGKIKPLRARLERLIAREEDVDRRFALAEHAVWLMRHDTLFPEGAESALERIFELDATHAALHVARARSLGAAGDPRGEAASLEWALLTLDRADLLVETHLRLATLAEDENTAHSYFQRAAAVDPTCREALRGLAHGHTRRREHRELADVLERLLGSGIDEEERAVTLARLAELYEVELRRPELAAERLESLVALCPDVTGALEHLERCYRAMKAFDPLLHTLSRRIARARGAARLELLREAALLREELGDVSGALDVYESLPEDEETLQACARLCMKLDRSKDAALHLLRLASALTDRASRARCYAQAAELLASLERHDEARAALEHAVHLDATMTSSWTALTDRARDEEDWPRLARYLEERIDSGRGDDVRAKLAMELGTLRRDKLGDHAGALEAFERALSFDPTSRAAARAALELLVEAGHYDDALPLCARLVPRGLDDQLCVMAIDVGYVTRSLERIAPAIRAARELGLDPERRRRLGILLAALEDDADALPLLEDAADDDPDDPEINVALAEVHVRAGRPDRAAELAHHLASAGATDRRIARLTDAARLLAMSGDLARAIHAMEEACLLRAGDRGLLRSLLALCQRAEDWARVADVRRKLAVVSATVHERAQHLSAVGRIAHEKLGDTSTALATMEEALSLDPSRLEAFETICTILTHAKDWRALADAYRRMLVRLRASPDAALKHALYHQLGLIYRDRLGDRQAALDAFLAAMAIDPDNDLDRQIVDELVASARRR